MPGAFRRTSNLNVIFSPQSTTTYTKMDHNSSARGARRKRSTKASKLLVVLSYVLDWVVLIVVFLAAGLIGRLTPNKRPFSLQDPDISFPYTVHETVTTTLLYLYAALLPIVAILLVCILIIPGKTASSSSSSSITSSSTWKRKLWELQAGWQGLALSIISATLITNVAKNLCGKPRPDLLARCIPDVANAAQYVVGFNLSSVSGASSSLFNAGGGGGPLFSADICTNTDAGILNDGFRSFPSGHSSTSAAGLVYLSLFLAAKFGVRLPSPISVSPLSYLALGAAPIYSSQQAGDETKGSEIPPHNGESLLSPLTAPTSLSHSRTQSHLSSITVIKPASPPLYLLLTISLPLFLAIFIASSRWFNYRHHGFDILSGFTIGLISAFFSIRYYHDFLTSSNPFFTSSSGESSNENGNGIEIGGARGRGAWAWSHRAPNRAFWAGGVAAGGWGEEAEVVRNGNGIYAEREDSMERARTSGISAAPSPYDGVIDAGEDIELGVRQRDIHVGGEGAEARSSMPSLIPVPSASNQ
ncbi:PAP2 superfamily-domain-containing protein [Xylariaceae sp. FL0255]|nr:PAP2 superfamily-domain-containing protein [Xylariaceae sp. FL0255]